MSSEPREGSDSNSVMWGGGGGRGGRGSGPSSPAAGDTAASNEPAVDGQDRQKGVMLQLDDRWDDDAQVYDARGDCIWLNTFLSKRTDTATYDDRVARAPVTERAPGVLGNDVVAVEMFTKELTPSDVGKLNRLVIPKKYATQHFSHVVPEGSAREELLMKFVDKEGHWWAFRYCYWKSSQSFVFTKGWNRFVKEKRLCAKDTVAFYQCNQRNGLRQPYCLIDIIRHVENTESKDDTKCREEYSSWSTSEGVEIGLRLGLGLNFKTRVRHHGDEVELMKKKMKTKDEDGETVTGSIMSPKMENKKRLKLFGEWIKIE